MLTLKKDLLLKIQTISFNKIFDLSVNIFRSMRELMILGEMRKNLRRVYIIIQQKKYTFFKTLTRKKQPLFKVAIIFKLIFTISNLPIPKVFCHYYSTSFGKHLLLSTNLSPYNVNMQMLNVMLYFCLSIGKEIKKCLKGKFTFWPLRLIPLATKEVIISVKPDWAAIMRALLPSSS